MPALPPCFDGSDLAALLGSGAFSGVVSIVHRGEKRLAYAAGLANRGMGRPNELHTCFPTASVSKMFTALCIARMVEEDLCGFDQPLVEAAPSLAPHFAPDITIASLLSHRSGLGDYIGDDAVMPFKGLAADRLDCLQAFLPLVLKVKRDEEDRSFRYSSAGYILLGLAIEEAGGLPFPEAIARWVTGPAGMEATGFPRLDDALRKNLATGYLADGSSNIGHLPIVGGPDGGIVTNTGDLLKLFARLREGSLLERSTLEFLLEPVNRISELSHYGHGFYISEMAGMKWHGHTGSDPGLSARVGFSLEEESSVVVLCNCDDAAFPVFRAVLEWISGIHS